jgi:hypothetical protein
MRFGRENAAQLGPESNEPGEENQNSRQPNRPSQPEYEKALTKNANPGHKER